MADYVYLLETRLSKDQQAAISAVRSIAREHELTVFLVGGAIRDLISGSPVRDLDIAVQGNALKLRKDLEKAGAEISSENAAMQALHLRFPHGVRVEVGSTLTLTYPKPGRFTVKPATILDDLRRRDFTANAMALSLNEGSYGLLMDPLNGVADIENRELRLVSSYGFIEDPVRLIRAARLMARLGWHLDEKTESRYETAKQEKYLSAMQQIEREYETEDLFREEDPLRVMQRLEEQGWLQQLAPSLGVHKANASELARFRDLQMQFQEHGVIADASAANFPLLTAKLSPKETLALRESFPRRSFVREIDTLDAAAKEFSAQLLSKQAALPSQAYASIMKTPAVVVLWTAFNTKSSALQSKFKSFTSEWPQARQKIPYLLMQEMRITPDLPQYDELVDKLALALMDGALETPEAARAFLEPYSPPAPPPPVSLRRPRAAKAAKKETRSAKSRKKPPATADEEAMNASQTNTGHKDSSATVGNAGSATVVQADQPAGDHSGASPIQVPATQSGSGSSTGTAKVSDRKAGPVRDGAKGEMNTATRASTSPSAAKTPKKAAESKVTKKSVPSKAPGSKHGDRSAVTAREGSRKTKRKIVTRGKSEAKRIPRPKQASRSGTKAAGKKAVISRRPTAAKKVVARTKKSAARAKPPARAAKKAAARRR